MCLGLLLFMTAALHAHNPRARLLALSAVAMAISITLFVIIKHDRPFVGYAAIPPEAILWASGVLY